MSGRWRIVHTLLSKDGVRYYWNPRRQSWGRQLTTVVVPSRCPLPAVQPVLDRPKVGCTHTWQIPARTRGEGSGSGGTEIEGLRRSCSGVFLLAYTQCNCTHAGLTVLLTTSMTCLLPVCTPFLSDGIVGWILGILHRIEVCCDLLYFLSSFYLWQVQGVFHGLNGCVLCCS